MQQWKNTADVINWFTKIEKKHAYKFMIFDIKDFYHSISEKLLKDSLTFSKKHIPVSTTSKLFNNQENI